MDIKVDRLPNSRDQNRDISMNHRRNGPKRTTQKIIKKPDNTKLTNIFLNDMLQPGTNTK